MSTANDIYTGFLNDVQSYLSSKLDGFPEHEVLEMTAYISNRVIVMLNDIIRERDRDWKRDLDRATRHPEYRTKEDMVRRAREITDERKKKFESVSEESE